MLTTECDCTQAFTEYFRTEELEEGKDLIIVPCDEGNGSGLVGCNGILVTHLWMRPAEEVRARDSSHAATELAGISRATP